MDNKQIFGSILDDGKQLGPFPVERIKRVDKPTTLLTEEIQRIGSRENAFRKAVRGDYGPAVEREALHTATKDPLSNSLADVRRFVATNETNEIFIENLVTGIF